MDTVVQEVTSQFAEITTLKFKFFDLHEMR